MTILISRVFAAAAFVVCLPLSNAHADVAPVDATAWGGVAVTAVPATEPGQPAPTLVAETGGSAEAAKQGMHGGVDHGAMRESAGTAKPMSSASSQAVGGLVVNGGFTRAMLPGAKVAGGYLTIVNSGTDVDRLVSVSSPAAGRVELHEMAMEGEVMRMRALTDGLTIAPGEAVSLRPGGNHLMFFDVAEPFEEGANIPVTLSFERAGTVDVSLPVLSAGATQAKQK
ncbi:copper chaperone PCu(A)C [Aurantimonas marina]|uniref:copper chaperone PCu(A)C n=1 Tax=Aurantimonas marina TaxID=2780508 RepID=UPI0019CF5831|nr:copper chaperone PCu(A)C [Aurantimonas marina]